MKSSVPHNTDPIGADKPLDKQNVIESVCCVNSWASTLSATAALKIRAPSVCNLILLFFAICEI